VAGFPTDLWTLACVTKVIEREFGVTYHPGNVWRILSDTVSGVYHRLGLYLQIHDQNINCEKVMGFLTMFHRHLRRKLIVVLDRYSAHRKAVRLFLLPARWAGSMAVPFT
jgi:hypothetical protein